MTKNIKDLLMIYSAEQKDKYPFPDRLNFNYTEWNNLMDLIGADDYGIVPNNSSASDKYNCFEKRDSSGNIIFKIIPFNWNYIDELENASNFYYKPGTEDEFTISWYKYPFRSAAMSKDLSETELRKIFANCCEAVK